MEMTETKHFHATTLSSKAKRLFEVTVRMED